MVQCVLRDNHSYIVCFWAVLSRKSSVHIETEPKKKGLIRSGYVFQSHTLSAALKPLSHSYSKTLKGPKDLMSYISYVPMCNPFYFPATAPALPLPPTLSVDCDMICNQLLHFLLFHLCCGCCRVVYWAELRKSGFGFR